jgi:pimeloyl-ACP methyl ester carboxylesterase
VCHSLDHQRYVDAWLDAVGVKDNVILVVHDWGSALGFNWAQRHADKIKALVYSVRIFSANFAIKSFSGPSTTSNPSETHTASHRAEPHSTAPAAPAETPQTACSP